MKNKIGKYLLFLIWPLGMLIYSIRNYRLSSSKNIVWLFSSFMGLAFIVSPESDTYRYIESFQSMSQLNLNLLDFLAYMFSETSGYIDLFIPFFNYLLSRFTSSELVFLALIGFLYGYFYSRCIWLIIDKTEGRLQKRIILFLLIFILLFPLWRGIKGPRFSIASIVFFLGIIQYLSDGKSRNLVLAHSSVFFHFSILFPIAIFWIYRLFKNRTTLYLTIYLITFFIYELNLQGVQDTLSFLPELFQKRVSLYTREAYALEITEKIEGLNWYIRYMSKMISWPVVLIILGIFIKKLKKLREDSMLFSVFNFSILLLAAANIASLIPSGGRMTLVGYMFAFFVFILLYQKEKPTGISNIINIVATPVLTLWVIVSIRIALDTTGIATIIGNPVFALFYENQTPLIDFIKGFI